MSNLPHYPQHPGHSPYPHPEGLAHPYALALPGSRLGARVLDVIIWYVIYMSLGWWLADEIDAGNDTARTGILVWLLTSYLIYFALPVWQFGSTVGKRICGVRIVDRETGGNPGFWDATTRELVWGVSVVIPVLGWLNSLRCTWDQPLRQCWHDKFADRVAVER